MRREQEYWEAHLAEAEKLQGQEEWLRYCRERYAEWVGKYLRGGQRVLKTDGFEEIRGEEVLDVLRARFGRVVVEDIAHSALRQAIEKWGRRGIQWVQAGVQELPYATGSFDGVVSLSTLDHFGTVEEIGESLRELARVTRPGGQLLLTLDNGGNPLVALRNRLPNGWLRALGVAPYEYGKTLGRRRLQREMERAGWKVVAMTAVVHEPRVLAVALAGGWWTAARLRRWLGPFGVLERLPVKWWTGYFLLAVGEKEG